MIKKTKEEQKEIKAKGFKTRFGATIEMCVINEKGEIEKKKMLSNDETKGFFTPNFSFFTGNKIILRTVRDSWTRYKFGTVELTD